METAKEILQEQFKCSKCGAIKGRGMFYAAKHHKSGVSSECKQCRLKRIKQYRIENKIDVNKRTYERRHANWDEIRNRSRKSYLKINYGLTPEDYEGMLESQGGGCAICGSRENFRGDQKMLHVDHDHKTGKNRGILCSKCNNGVGYFDDSVELLTKAIAYLKKYK